MTQVPPSVVPVCYRHPKRETYVRCSRCERPICPDCMTEAAVGHQCPECVAEGRRTQRPVRTVFGGTDAGRHGYATISLIALNVIVMILSAISAKSGSALAGGSLGGIFGSNTPLTEWGAVHGLDAYYYEGTKQLAYTAPAGIATGEWYRLFTAMFLHYGLLHIVMNMWALWVLGRGLEAMLGPVRFVALYLLCGLGGNVAVYVFAPEGYSAGASTAIFGLFAAFFLVLKKLGRDASSIIPVLVINLVITFTVPGISIAGHVGGLVTGALVAAGLVYAPREHRNKVQAAAMVATLALLFGMTVVQTVVLNS